MGDPATDRPFSLMAHPRIRHGATTVGYTTLISYSSPTLLLAIAAIAVLSQVQSGTDVSPGVTAEVSG